MPFWTVAEVMRGLRHQDLGRKFYPENNWFSFLLFWPSFQKVCHVKSSRLWREPCCIPEGYYNHTITHTQFECTHTHTIWMQTHTQCECAHIQNLNAHTHTVWMHTQTYTHSLNAYTQAHTQIERTHIQSLNVHTHGVWMHIYAHTHRVWMHTHTHTKLERPTLTDALSYALCEAAALSCRRHLTELSALWISMRHILYLWASHRHSHRDGLKDRHSSLLGHRVANGRRRETWILLLPDHLFFSKSLLCF